MTRTSTRRRYLAAGVATGLAAVAGCSDLIENYDEAEDTPEENSSENSSGGDASGAGENETGDETVTNVEYEGIDGELRILQPEDGAQVESPVTFEMEVENFELQPAEDDQNDDGDESGTSQQGAGHLHVIVDEGCLDPGYVIPEDEGYHHLSEGETQTDLELESGEHEICAQAGDDQHNAYDLTDEITIEVTGGDGGNESDSDNVTDDDADGDDAPDANE